MTRIFDSVSTVAKKDLEIAIRSIKSLTIFTNVRNVYVITAKENFYYLERIAKDIPKVLLIDEDNLIEGVTLGSLKDYFAGQGADVNRAGWYLQQFCKMSASKLDDLSDF